MASMTGFDDPGVFFSDNFGGGSEEQSDNRQVQRTLTKKKLRDFLREFHVTTEGGVTYAYRDQLKRNYNLGEYWVEIDLGHLASYDDDLADCLTKQPVEYHPLFEQAAKEIADEVTRPRPEGEEVVHAIQVLLQSNAIPTSVRSLKADMMSKLVKVPGIIVSATAIRAKAIKLGLQCRSCRATINDVSVKPGFEGYSLPRKCVTEAQGREPCPLDPFFIVPEKCECVDFQTLKLQEAPDAVPQGEMPRHLQLYIDQYLCDKVVPGNKVTVIGIYAIRGSSTSVSAKSWLREIVFPKLSKTNFKKFQPLTKDRKTRGVGVGIRTPYLRVLGVEAAAGATGHKMGTSLTPEEEEKIRRLTQNPNIYDVISRSIAPSIFGSDDIKKAIACLLFGGSRKRLPDGLTRRGDINILMLGDPGTAKSQLLKFVEQVSPIAVYTSGKGSSAAGLTASVMKDPSTRNFVMEGGAMVLADGGVVCIDEFDKMREDDRVAIHEAMEQQTISIAKAGITTTLNSRCSVLAAANSVYGRWDDTKGEQNIDFMPTILSRFDMIFIVKDQHDQARDITLAKHVMGVHMTAQTAKQTATEGEINLQTLKKYIAYARNKCGPRLSATACEKLKNRYVLMRAGAHSHEVETERKTSIPITVRQLEAIVRISESLAKMRLAPFAGEAEVDEALRLFQKRRVAEILSDRANCWKAFRTMTLTVVEKKQNEMILPLWVSTLDAAMTGNLAGVEGFTSDADHEMLNRIEKQIKRRFVIGSQVSEYAIVQDFTKQKYPERAIYKVLQLMIKRGEIQHRMQRKMMFRVK